MRNMKRGFALVTVLAVLIMIVFGTVALISAVSSHTSVKSRSIQELKAQYLAEAAMQWAVWDCKANPSNCGNPRIAPIGGQNVTITTTGVPGNYTFVVKTPEYTGL